MSRFVADRRPGLLVNRITPLLCMILVLTFCGAGRLSAQVVATYNFDDGKADGWGSFYNASTPVASNAEAYSGTYSLLTTTSATGTGGPSISMNTVLLAGAKYTITGWVRLGAGESAANANFTIARTDPSCSGGTCYDTIGAYQVAVSDAGWAEIGGAYSVSTTETALLLYSQLVGATSAVSFYMDDVVITETAPPPGGTPVETYTWADDKLDGWAPFGSAKLTVEATPVPDPSSDAKSLLVSNRTGGFMGPSLNLVNVKSVVAGATYQVTAYVLLEKADSSNPTATISTKLTDCADTSGAYSNLATSTALSHTAWTKVQGNFSFSDLPGAPTNLILYIQSSSATDSFYIAHVTINELAPPPPTPSQQDNSGITSTFEDGGLDGWSSRSGSSSVTNSTAEAHGGTHSLLTTGRIGNWDGPSISVSDKMYVGSVYNISGWVMMLPTDGSSHIVNISLQTTLDGNTSYPSVTGYPGVTVPADGKWHQISVTGYNMSSGYDTGAATLYFQTVPPSGNDLASFYIDDFQLSYVPPPTIQTSLASIYQTYASEFPIGAAVDLTDLSGPHLQLLVKHFDSITSGNDMKWSSVEATKGAYTFDNADSEVGMAVCHNIRIRGHNLVWATAQQTPSYATGDGTNSPANQAVVTANIQEHIKSEVQHFGSKVYAWDVVNEPLDPTQSDCLVHGPFYQVLGKSYIDIALKAARQYAPAGTKLFLNDYSTADPDRLACYVKVVKDLKTRGIPLDAVGHENHNAINYPSTAAIVNAIDTMHENFPTLDQQITELDMSVYNAGDTTSNYGNNIPASVLAEQGWLYEQYFDAFRGLKDKGLTGITFWGMADDDTWLDSFPVNRTDYPLPFNMQLHAKPAYWGVVNASGLPGYGLKLSLAGTSTSTTVRKWTVTAANGNVGPAYNTLLAGFTLKQTGGVKCTPVVTPPSAYPVSLGNIATSKSASAAFTINFAGCKSGVTFTVAIPWSVATYDTGTWTDSIEFH